MSTSPAEPHRDNGEGHTGDDDDRTWTVPDAEPDGAWFAPANVPPSVFDAHEPEPDGYDPDDWADEYDQHDANDGRVDHGYEDVAATLPPPTTGRDGRLDHGYEDVAATVPPPSHKAPSDPGPGGRHDVRQADESNGERPPSLAILAARKTRPAAANEAFDNGHGALEHDALEFDDYGYGGDEDDHGRDDGLGAGGRGR